METKPVLNAATDVQPPLPDTHTAAPARRRLDGIDCVRGIVMVLMALDHTRDYLGGGTGLPRDVHDPALFLTRWITNFCAPTFVFLAGVGAFLYGQRSASKPALSRFLLTRGLWLVLCELTLVRYGWSFSLRPDFLLLQVIWAIGWSMVLLSGLVLLPRAVPGLLGLAIILGHDLLDGVTGESWGSWKVLWTLLHRPGLFQQGFNVRVLAVYPLIPWLGVMLAGYGFGPIFQFDAARRRRALYASGTGCLLLFSALRLCNWYGDPAPWTVQTPVSATLLSFVNCEKYPPSLLFLAMTLGVALLSLGALDQAKGLLARFFVTFGRVPFFYYLAHIYLIHAAALLVAAMSPGGATWLVGGLPPMVKPNGWGFGLPVVYAFWVAVVLMLYPFCRWFARVKQARKEWWLSYL